MNSGPMNSGNWLRHLHAAARPRARLVCLPWAGASASSYVPWVARMPTDVDLISVQYPGRQDRWGESCIDDVKLLARQVAAAVQPHADCPVALFGHSMGAWVAYETALLLDRLTWFPLSLVVVSGQLAPHLAGQADDPRGQAPPDDDAMIAALDPRVEIDPELLADPTFLKYVLPAIRTDFHATWGYARPERAPLGVPLVGYVGDCDPWVTVEDVRAWADLSADFSMRMFSGGHFYLNDCVDDIVEDVLGRLSQVILMNIREI